MNAVLIIQIELIATAVAGLLFVVLFLASRANRATLFDPHPGVRGAARHLVILTVITSGEVTILAMVANGIRLPIVPIAIGYGLGFLVVVHRVYLLVRANPSWWRRWLPSRGEQAGQLESESER